MESCTTVYGYQYPSIEYIPTLSKLARLPHCQRRTRRPQTYHPSNDLIFCYQRPPPPHPANHHRPQSLPPFPIRYKRPLITRHPRKTFHFKTKEKLVHHFNRRRTLTQQFRIRFDSLPYHQFDCCTDCKETVYVVWDGG